MLLTRLVDVSAQVRATRSRLAKRDALAALLPDTTPDDLPTVVSWLSGRLTQRRTGLGWAGLRDVPEPAAEPSLTVAEVQRAFDRLAATAGSGSQASRRTVVADLYARATAPEQAYLTGLLLEDVRQGALDTSVQDAVAQAYGVPIGAVRRAAMLLGSTVRAAEIAAARGLAGLHAVRLTVGVPVSPMLAGTAPDVATALAKADAGGGVLVDRKLDGIRVQVHRVDDAVRVFTRSLDDITDRLPETVEAVRALPATRLVLDGEVIILRPDGRPAPFQVTGSRTASSADVAALRRQAPVSTYFFDVLLVDGVDLLDSPLAERLEQLAAAVPVSLRVPAIRTADVGEAQRFFAQGVEAGHEGVVVKRLDSPYEAGRRGSGWVKAKPRLTLDLVVLAAEWGSGRRVGWLSNLHLGARADDGFVMLGKTFKGLTDQLLTWQTERLLAREVRRTRSTVFVRPELVVEIALDGVQASTRYPGGVVLRFARVVRYRDDKAPAQADTLATVRALLPG